MRVWILVLACGLSIGASASVLHREPGQKPTPEQSQAQVGEQQKLQGTFDVVGVVERDTEPNLELSDGGSGKAAGMVAGVDRDLSSAQSDAAAVVARASKELENDKGSAAGTAAWGLLVLALGFFGVMGVRRWVAQSMPEPAAPKNIEW